MSDYRLKLFRGMWCAVRSVDGKTRRYSLRTRDPDEARRRLIDFSKAPAAETVGDLVSIYLTDKDKTAIRAVDLHGSWANAKAHFSHLRPDQVTREVCRAYVAMRAGAGRKPATIRKELECVRAAVNFNKRGAGAVFELPPQPPHKDRRLTRYEAKRLALAARRFAHVRAFIILSLCTAARSTALLQLTWDRVDLDRRVIHLALGDSLDDQRKSRARVPMNRRAFLYLRTMKAAAMSDHVIEWGGDRVRSIKKGFRAAVVRAGLDPAEITPHVLRHTAASWMAEAGVPMLDISKMLGHTDARVTERVYAHLSPDYLRTAANVLRF